MKPVQATAWSGALVRYGCLAAALICASMTVGNVMVPVAAWLAPVFLLRFVRQSLPLPGLGLGALALATGHVIAWYPVLPFQGWMRVAVPGALGLAFFVPYVIDRWLSPRLRGLAATLVFPSAWAACEYLIMQLGFGSWGAIGYSQYGNLPLLQLLSVTGLTGLTFLIGWFAACANQAWEARFATPRLWWPLLACAGVIAAVLLAGGLRVAAPQGVVATVRVAGVTIDNMAVFLNTWRPLSYGTPLTAAQAEAAREQTQELHRTLLEHSRAEARSGAKLIVWSESNALVLKQDEADFIRAGRRLAQEEGVYLFMTMATITPGEPLAENKLVVVDPQGQVRGAYLKSHPAPGESSITGKGRMGILDTPYGRIAWAICYDFDFPGLVRQAGRAGADIMINPSWDNAAITPMHSYMASLRSVETGASMFRQVNDGLSLAVNGHGRTLGMMDHASGTGEVRTFVADLPVKGVHTLYSRLGDAVPLLSAMVLAALVIVARRNTGAA